MYAERQKRDGKPVPPTEDMRVLFNQIDVSGDGKVDLSEYVQWALREVRALDV